MADSFAHLHVHTEYSMLDGAARLKDLFVEADRLGMSAVAITDHGNMHGAYDFYKQATAAGITPILGVEAYVAPESRFHKARVKWGEPHQKSDDVSGNGAITHMTMWARNSTGLHNLFTLNSRASVEGHYVKWPRMDMELISEYADGIMATTGCPSGAVQTRLRLGQFDEAVKVAGQYQEIFGKEHYFLELMNHGLDIERRVRDGLVEIGRKLNIPPVVTNDSHYTVESQAEAHDVLLCVQTASNISDPNRFRLEGGGYFIKSADQMRAVDSSEIWAEGCRNTLLVAEKVDPTGMFTFRNLMPRFPVPEGETEESWFRKETFAGLARRYPDGIPETHLKQAEYELGVIIQMGFPSYFLVVADFIMWAKSQGIAVGPGRGSAAGSLVAYAMGITDLDPLLHGLIFERFLNPERVQMPDMDIDFDERRRGEVIRYVTDKWGADRVAQIATFGRIKAKAAIKDSAKVLGYPYSVGDRITKALPPPIAGVDPTLAAITDSQNPRYRDAGAIRELLENDPVARTVVETAQGIEGLIRQTGVHAAGVIMSSEPISDVVPVMKRPVDGAIITQFDFPTCETLGLLKMDFLGLRNLTIIDDAVKNVEINHGFKLDLLGLALDDKPTYELLSRGDTLGVFQLDSDPIRKLLRMIHPDNFEDISAVLALYRPGPMGADSHTNYALRKSGRQEIAPIHPELAEPLEEILGPTYGLIVYQEQVQRAAQKLAGYSLGQADNLRRAMGKKKKAVLDKEYVPFRDGMRNNGYSDEAIKTLWDILVPFADYAFNKAHTASYGLVAYWTAYLKANYPAEYMAGLLTSVGDDKEKMALYLGECRRMGIKVLVPDVNSSRLRFTAVNGVIRFGLGAIRDVGASSAQHVVATRESGAPYASFVDFVRRAPAGVCNKTTVGALIRAGAFDSLGHSRRGLIERYEDCLAALNNLKRQEEVGQFDLFSAQPATAEAVADGLPAEFATHEWNRTELLNLEREALGLYVSGHPLDGAERVLARYAKDPIAAVADPRRVPDNKQVAIAGLIVEVRQLTTRKSGELMAAVIIEDLAAQVEVMFFPSAYRQCADALAVGAVVAIRARTATREGERNLHANSAMALDVETGGGGGSEPPLVLTLPAAQVTAELGRQLDETLARHAGARPVWLRLRGSEGETVVEVCRSRRVRVGPTLRADLIALLGAGVLA